MCNGQRPCYLVHPHHGILMRVVFVVTCLLCAGISPAAAEPAPEAATTELNNQGVKAAQAKRFEESAQLLRQGLAINPADAALRKNLAGVLVDWARQEVAHGRWSPAVPLLEEAVKLQPELGPAWALLGNLYYVTRPDFSAAIQAWTQAHRLAPAAEAQTLAAQIAQAERDLRIERAFAGHETTHFVLRADQGIEAGKLEYLAQLLEQAYGQLQQTFAAPMPARVTVLLYDGGDYRRIAGRKDWSLGLYDGRIRLRMDELSADQLPAVVAHELTHAYLASLYGPGLPAWVQEGLAQMQEPPQPLTPRQIQVREALLARTDWVPLSWLRQRFERPGHAEDVERAYMESRLVMEALIAQQGWAQVQAWLSALSRGEALPAAFERAFPGRRWARIEQGALQP